MGRMRRLWAALAAVGASIAVAGGCSAPPVTPQQQIDQIVQFVETARGHQFVTPPVVEFLSDDVFRSEVLASLDAAEPGVDADDVAFTALGWISPGESLWDEYRIAFGGGVVGFYDPVTKDDTKRFQIDRERVEHWLKQGAQPSDTVKGLLLEAGIAL